MKQKLFIFLSLILLLGLLVGLNALSYKQKEKVPDSEDNPNRSTYNVGATGTRAFYDLLAETGREVTRWEESFPNTARLDVNQFSTFVIIGKTRREFEQKELDNILDWVAVGGKLVLIDRYPNEQLLSTTSDWSISQTSSETPTLMTDPSNQMQMIANISAIKPVQPTLFTQKVNAVQPSQFAPSININKENKVDEEEDIKEEISDEELELDSPTVFVEPSEANTNTNVSISETGIGTGNKEIDEIFETPESTPIEQVEIKTPTIKGDKSVVANADSIDSNEVFLKAPVIHLANDDTNLLVDFQYGLGEIVFLSDPYIVANGGIKLVDNAQLATNVVTSRRGIIAFDEYHQGFGKNDNRLFEYFEGTPVMAIFLQLFLIIGLLMYSQSRRFARALPNDESDRLSKLEYVSAMAQLQGRTKAFDLAIENIYTDFRRRVSILVGIDNHTAKREDIAEKIAERTDYNAKEIADLMFQCEDIMHGEPAKKKETVKLISRLREVEESLGLRRGKNRRRSK